MKVIFLDFDGVLNSHNSFTYHRMTNRDNIDWTVSNPNFTSVTFIDYLLYVTGAKIVISSSWRGDTVEKLQETLNKEFGLKRVSRVIDQTPRLWDVQNNRRGAEIQYWLNRNSVENYVIIDDGTDMLPSHKEHLINTNFEHGFTVTDMNKVIDLFGCTDEENKVHNSEVLVEGFRNGKDYFKD